MKDLYVIKDGKKLRCGYTTGSCAAGAAKAAAIGIIYGKIPDYVQIDTPSGIVLNLKVDDKCLEENYASCCIVKDAGDDPDVTDGIKIYAKVSKRDDKDIVIDGGEGIGVITRDGFWGKTGDKAINKVPRKMIENEIRKISSIGFDVLIYTPEGSEIAKKTFNSNIGIEGGISIIGTTGIVEPMSEEALLKSIYIDIDLAFEKSRNICLCLGNYALDFMKDIPFDGEKVKISNFIGDSISYCRYKGFNKVLLVGNIGKLCKLSIGVFNTHSRICDGRIEAFIYHLALLNAPFSLLNKINGCKTSEEALKICIEEGYKDIGKQMKESCIKRIKSYVKDEDFNIDVIIYSMEFGML
ncbi:MAG: cobalt-precorrin-5B (C(1))-methyltransferase CbiD [Caloramator sp.]|nr:cobalt-precorrin-5B (C(1))-methyltransferase CbiD [Caloramator sp.]